MNYKNLDFAVITPLANESDIFDRYIKQLLRVLDDIGSGKVYFVVDKASKDNTLELCEDLSKKDKRFITIWAPENKNVVDAYIRGYKEAVKNKHEYIIEMDGGLSHDPRALPMFLRALNEGHECVFGSRFIHGGSIQDSSFKRILLSRGGTFLSNLLLGTKMYDMTSGYQGFHLRIAEQLIEYDLLSTAHFYQSEVRYLLRKTRWIEVPIHYTSASPRVSRKAISNAIAVLFHYFFLRITFRSPYIK
jgi:dolichol-phosphate mannosyltransferase